MTSRAPALVALLAVLVRTSALLGTAPLLDTLAVGLRLKAALALVVALLDGADGDHPGPERPLDPFGLGALVLRETAMGQPSVWRPAPGRQHGARGHAARLPDRLLGPHHGGPHAAPGAQRHAPPVGRRPPPASSWRSTATTCCSGHSSPPTSWPCVPAPDWQRPCWRLSARIFPLALTMAAPLLLTLWLTDLALGVAQAAASGAGRAVRLLSAQDGA